MFNFLDFKFVGVRLNEEWNLMYALLQVKILMTISFITAIFFVPVMVVLNAVETYMVRPTLYLVIQL